jgi:hypothetical protein
MQDLALPHSQEASATAPLSPAWCINSEPCHSRRIQEQGALWHQGHLATWFKGYLEFALSTHLAQGRIPQCHVRSLTRQLVTNCYSSLLSRRLMRLLSQSPVSWEGLQPDRSPTSGAEVY